MTDTNGSHANTIKSIDHDLHPRRLCIVKVYEDGHRVRVAQDLTVHDVAKWPCSPQQDGRGKYRYSQMLNSTWLEHRSVQVGMESEDRP